MLYQLNRRQIMTRDDRNCRGKRRTHSSRRQPTLEALERRIVLSTLTVLNNADSGPGSLRAEIAATTSGDTIAFSPTLKGRTINLTSGELVVSKSLSINGGAAANVTVSGGNVSRVFDISGDANVTFRGLNITDGSSNAGGGVLVESGSSLNITQCTLTANRALGDSNGNALGGAIWNQGGASLNISQSGLSGNETDGRNQSYGGAVYNQGSLRVTSSSFSLNQALGSTTSFDELSPPGGSLGGAILNDDGATMTASQSSFVQNEAVGDEGGDALGGAIDNESASVSLGVHVSISNCTFVSNQAISGINLGNGNQGGFGGAIEDLAGTTIRISGSTFARNEAAAMAPATTFASSYASGGAIDNGASAFSSLSVFLTVDGSTFTGNVASGGQDLAPGFGNFSYGGAVSFNIVSGLSGSLSFSNSTFISNLAVGGGATDGELGPGFAGPGSGGAIFAGSPLSVTNCTFIGNQAIGGSADGSAGYGEGGGIDAQADLTVMGSVFYGNEAAGGGGGTNSGVRAGFFSGYAAGGGIAALNGVATISGSILIGNRAVGGFSSSGLGGFAAGGGIEGYYSTLNLAEVTLASNTALGGEGGPGGQGGGGAGGGIDLEVFSSADMIGLTLVNNSAAGGAAGPGGEGGVGIGGGISAGFEIFLIPIFAPDGSTLSLSASTLSGNRAVGGAGGPSGFGGDALGGGIAVVGEDTATVEGSELNLDSASGGSGVSGGNGLGGGIYVDIGSGAGVTRSVITGNQASGGPETGGSAGQGIGGGVYYLGTFTFDAPTVVRMNRASTSNNDIFSS